MAIWMTGTTPNPLPSSTPVGGGQPAAPAAAAAQPAPAAPVAPAAPAAPVASANRASTLGMPQAPALDEGKTWGNPQFTRPLNFGHKPGPDGQLIKWNPMGQLVWADNGKAVGPDQWVCMPAFQREALQALIPAAQRQELTARLQQGQAARATRPEPSPEAPAAEGGPVAPGSANGAQQAQALLAAARRGSAGRRPDGRCYAHVWKFMEQVGYGKFPQVGIPDSHAALAKQFAQLVNPDPARFGLRRLNISNPYDAPAGAIVVVGPGSPGTAHPTAGDIAVADGKGGFYNGGEMGYGGRQGFPPGNRHVLGVYLPA